MRNRNGFSLSETLVVLVVLGVIGASMAQVLTVQSRFIRTQEGRSEARSAARSGANLVLSELRMIEVDSGVVAATAKALTLRVPYWMGIACESTASETTVAVLPVDSVVLAEAGVSGVAVRGADGKYDYYDGTYTVGNGTTSKCTGATPAIDPVFGGRVVRITPAAPGATPGTPLFLYQRVRYEFKNSVAVPGRIGLWRAVIARSLDEELVAPFDTTARFRFYTDGSTTPQAAVPSPLNLMRGVELQLVGVNERAGAGGSQELVPYTTSVFFKNR